MSDGRRQWAWRRRGRRRAGGRSALDRGSGPVEFAIVAGALLLVTFVVLQVGLVYFARSIALGAATQGVSAGRAYNLADPHTAATNATQNFLNQAGDGLTGQSIAVTNTSDGLGIEVEVTGNAISVVPGLTFGVRQSARGSFEQPTT